MKIKAVLAATVAALASTATTQASESGAYGSLAAGVHMPGSEIVNLLQPPRVLQAVSTDFSTGWNVIAAAGYHLAGYRAEVEGGYRRTTVSKVDGGAANGHQGLFSLMSNLLFDLGGGGFQPYLGGGVGVAWNKWHTVHGSTTATLPTGTPTFDGTSSPAFQYQGIAGVSFPIAGHTALFADYHFIGTTGSMFTSPAPAGSTVKTPNDTSHNIMVGLRFHFGG